MANLRAKRNSLNRARTARRGTSKPIAGRKGPGRPRTPAQAAALKRAQIASARKRKGTGKPKARPDRVQKLTAQKKAYKAKSGKKLASKRFKRKGLEEYVDTRGRKSGLATNIPKQNSKLKRNGNLKRRDTRKLFKTIGKGQRYNKRTGKKLNKFDKKIAKAKAKKKR